MIRFITNLARLMLIVVPFNWIAYIFNSDAKFIWVSLVCFLSGMYLYTLAGTLDSIKNKRVD